MKFELDDQQRDFAASIDAALASADVPAVVRAWAGGDTAPGRKIWARLADLGVTALAVPERFDGLDAHPVDLVVALERLGRWCVPGPVTESIAVAPVLLADDERCAALAAGELLATVALPPQVPRAVDADTAGLVLLADSGRVSEADAGESYESVDPSRRLFDVAATGSSWDADVARAYEFGALATAAQLVGAGQALLDTAVDYAKQRAQFGRVIGSYQAIKHRLAEHLLAVEAAAGVTASLAAALDAGSPDASQLASAAKAHIGDAAVALMQDAIQIHGGIGMTWEHDLHLHLRRASTNRVVYGGPAEHRERLCRLAGV